MFVGLKIICVFCMIGRLADHRAQGEEPSTRIREKESVGPSVLWGPGWTSLHQATELGASERGQEGKGQSLQRVMGFLHEV